MHGFEFTQFDIFSLEIIAAQSCYLAMVISFKAQKKKQELLVSVDKMGKGLVFYKMF